MSPKKSAMTHQRTRRDFLDTSSRIFKSTAAVAVAARIATIGKSVAGSDIVRIPTTEDEFEQLADSYSLADSLNYLNHASIGTIPVPVQNARNQYLDLCESNPWLYMWGDAWSDSIDGVRAIASELLGCKTDELAITHNTTEMFNTLANGLPLSGKDEVLFSSLSHSGASVAFLEMANRGEYLARQFEISVTRLPEITAGQVLEIYARQIRPNTKMLVIPHIDNTWGIRYPVRKIVEMARSRNVRYVAVDAAQSIGMIPTNCRELGIDVLATSGHKWIGGPKGTGLAFVSERIQGELDPMWVTWGQKQWSGSARKYEDYGTRNLPEVLALGDAIRFMGQPDIQRRSERLQDLWAYTQQLVDRIESLSWNSPREWTTSASLYSIRVQRPAQQLAQELFQKHGVVVRPFTSPGLNNLRVSPNVFTSKHQLARLIELIS